MSFCTAVNCIDGRVQLPVIRYLQERYGVLYVDVVSESGPVHSLAEPADRRRRGRSCNEWEYPSPVHDVGWGAIKALFR